MGLGGHIPIIALTAYAMPKVWFKFLSARMNNYITKSITGKKYFLYREKIH